MKVLVTGGAGFIGGHVCEALADRGHEPVIFDRFRHGRQVANGLDSVLGDVLDLETIGQAVYHTDAVIHLAGVLGTQETIRHPRPAIATNIAGSVNVFQACAEYRKRCVYIAVGNYWMLNPYSITKTTAESFAYMFNRELGSQIAVVRGLNAYGPGQKPKPVRKVIPNFIAPALRDEELVVYGDGKQIMDMIFVADLADILCRALLLEHGVFDRAFEAGTGRRTTVLEIAERVIALCGGGRIRFEPMRPGEPPASEVVADVSTLAPLGPFNPLDLEAGLAATVNYYRELASAGGPAL